MNLFISKTVSSVLQIILFSLIPFIWWIITAYRQYKFSQWIGLKKFNCNKKTFTAIVIISVAFMISGLLTLYIIKDVTTAVSEFLGLGIRAIPSIIIYAVFNTALPEEILFRGFIFKRLLSRYGFNVANIIQSLLFGILHGIMFFLLTDIFSTLIIISFTTVVAWFMGYINEKYAEGSIIPSWFIHSIANFVSGICMAFSFI